MRPSPANTLSRLELTGRVHTHVQHLDELGCMMHPQAASALLAMRTAARQEGIDLTAVSGFRDINRQLLIWNGKFSGARALLSAQDTPLDVRALSDAERVAAILVWSALPGASRHHWGTDCDVIDRRALEPEARIELLSTDYGPGGRYARLSSWLSGHAHHYGFFLPYDRYRGGVQPEPWHLSFARVAVPALAAMSVELLAEALSSVELAGRDAVMQELPNLFERHVTAVAEASEAALAAAALSRATRLA